MTSRTLVLVLTTVAFVVAACGGDGPTLTSENAPSDVIAFGAQTPAGDGLYIVRPDGSGLQLLQSELDLVSSLVWSPDGGRIAYLVGNGDVASLRVFDFDTQAATTVSQLGVTSTASRAASWSPDGRRLAFTEAAGEGRLISVYDVERNEAFDFPRIIGAEPDWSPDGQELAFVRAGESPGLYVISADGKTTEELLMEASGRIQAPAWSPDGNQIVVTEGEAGSEALSLLDRESGVVSGLGPGLHPAWSSGSLSDSGQLVFSALTAGSNTDLDIYFIAAEGGARQFISQAVTRELWPTWAPDGVGVTYLSQADRQTAFICVVRLQADERDCMNLPDILPASPAWSPR